jgi:uncharacterized Zn-binding protein involved in type VI secretion
MTSGQIGMRSDGTMPIDPIEQLDTAFDNVERNLTVAWTQGDRTPRASTASRPRVIALVAERVRADRERVARRRSSHVLERFRHPSAVRQFAYH